MLFSVFIVDGDTMGTMVPFKVSWVGGNSDTQGKRSELVDFPRWTLSAGFGWEKISDEQYWAWMTVMEPKEICQKVACSIWARQKGDWYFVLIDATEGHLFTYLELEDPKTLEWVRAVN